MSAKKWLTIITFIFSIGALCIVLTIGNASKSMAYDIALATFGSALLGFIMSLTEYFTERKSAMEQFWLEGQSALKKLREIKYFQCDAPIDLITACFQEESTREFNEKYPDLVQLTEESQYEAKEKLKIWFLENTDFPSAEDSLADKMWEDYYKTRMDKYKKAILDSIDSYRKAATIDLVCLDNAYGNMDFLFGNCKLRKNAYSNIYDKLREYRDAILKEKYHFDLLQSGEGNFVVCIDKMLQLNRIFFL